MDNFVQASMPRPTPVTVVAWVIIGLSIEALIPVVFGLGPKLIESFVSTSLPIQTTVWATIVVVFANIAFATFILLGHGWARVAYLALLGIGIFGMLLQHQSPAFIAVATVKAVVFPFFLFSKDANAHFNRPSVSVTQQSLGQP